MSSTSLVPITLLLCILTYNAFCAVQNNEQITGSTDWDFNPDTREGSLRATSLLRFFNALWYQSLEINTDKSSAALNYISGACAAEIIGSSAAHYPAATFGFFMSQVTVNRPTQDNAFNLEVDLAAGFMASSFYQLEEKDPSGNIVETLPLNRNNYVLSAVGSKGPLKWATYTARLVKNGGLFPPDTDYRGNVSITFLISDEVGTVDFNTDVSPTTLESIIQIAGYKYADPANNLVLTMGVAAGSASWEGDLGVVMQQTTNSTVFFKLAKDAVYAASVKPVQISAFKTSTFEAGFGNNVQLKAELTKKFKGNWEARVVEVAFDAGAELITYDPTLGTEISSFKLMHVSLLVLLLVTLLLL